MSRSVWLVTGECGEYSDRTNWTVATYYGPEAESQARLHVRLANQHEASLPEGDYLDDDYDRKLEAWCEAHPYDKARPERYFEPTTYRCEEVPLVGHVDQYIEEHTKQ